MKEKLIVQIVCDKEVGTAFYVASDLLLTAYHTVASYKDTGCNIIKNSNDGDLKFKRIRSFESADIAILKVDGRTTSSYLQLLSHRFKIGEDIESYGYPDQATINGLRIDGQVNQKILNSPADYILCVKDVDVTFDYEGMSGAPIFFDNNVAGIVIEQSGNSLNVVSIQKIRESLENEGITVEDEPPLMDLPTSIAKNVEASRPNYEMYDTLDTRLEAGNHGWLLLHGTPGCGKTTLSASYEPRDNAYEIIGRFFFKVPNDLTSRAVRCSQNFFIDWLESVYISKTNTDVRKLSPEEKKKRIPQWFLDISNLLLQEGKQGILIIDGVDELATDTGNRVDDFLSLIPETRQMNIRIVLSCISESILSPDVIEKIAKEDIIEVTPLNMASCESYIHDNSGDWSKPYSFIQAVANKTEGHPLYMNYLCRYLAEMFDSNTKESDLYEWVDNLPTIGGDIYSYYEAVWKKTESKSGVIEILALLSQTRGAVEENQLIAMTKEHNPFRFKSYTKDFQHLMKDQNSDMYEIYHSSFRLFVTEKLASIIKYTNDQIANYCSLNKDTVYSIENYLHHIVNGSDAKYGLLMCNQEWADNCTIHDVSPDLIMHDIKECLSIAVDFSLPTEVIRLMLLAQRIENRCDSIMVDNVDAFVNLNIALGKPGVAMKYIVRDNILLVDLPNAMRYLQVLFELGYREQAFILADSINAYIRKSLGDTTQNEVDINIFVAKGFLIVEGILAGVENPADLVRYLNKTLCILKADGEENTNKLMLSIRDAIIAYQLANQVRAGKRMDMDRCLKMLNATWNERLVMLIVHVLVMYDEKETGLHRMGHNDAYTDCLAQLEKVLLNNTFSFSTEDLKMIVAVLIDKPIDASVVLNILTQYEPKPDGCTFRQGNGVDVDMESLENYYHESMYLAYLDDKLICPVVSRCYYSYKTWEKYLESLVARIAYIKGVLYRKRAAKEDYSSKYELVKETLDSIDFSFDIRSIWERSYLLPEDVMPFIYDKLAEIYCDFFEDRVCEFMAHVQNRIPDQLGLYREGCCAVLIGLIRIFRMNGNMREQTLYLADNAVKYVMYAVQNRSERCTYLLQICMEYALLNEVEKVDEIYKEVLNSSMGPEWYKEGQLGLLNAIKETNITFDRIQAAHMAAIFEEASGEMTFQRYVQQSKNRFTGTLVKSASLTDAIAYYKFETLPAPEIIKQNAEGWKVDMPRLGDGYDLGANHLIESSAICYLLRESKDVSPYIRYAVSELFWENWDKMHNDRNYAKLHAELLNVVGEQTAKDILLPRMAGYFVNEYSLDKKGDYLGDLEELNVSEVVLDLFQISLNEYGYGWNRKKRKFNMSEYQDSYSEKLQKLPTCKAMLDELKREIVSPMGSYWYSLDQFLVTLTKKSDFDKTQLLDVITSHFDVNVHPSKQQIEKFNWFVGKYEENDVDKQMIHFLIWFLVHPEKKVLLRAQDALKWLVKIDARVIACLIEEILEPSEIGLSTASSAILLEIAQEIPNLVLQYLQSVETQKKLSKVANFSVSRNMYEIALLLQEQFGQEDFLNIMKPVIPDSMPDRKDVMFDNNEMMFIEYKIDELNALKVTGGREFAKPYLKAVKEMGGIDKMSELIKADHYAARSFYLNTWQKGRYDRMMVDILDRILYGKIDYKRAERTYYAING